MHPSLHRAAKIKAGPSLSTRGASPAPTQSWRGRWQAQTSWCTSLVVIVGVQMTARFALRLSISIDVQRTPYAVMYMKIDLVYLQCVNTIDVSDRRSVVYGRRSAATRWPAIFCRSAVWQTPRYAIKLTRCVIFKMISHEIPRHRILRHFVTVSVLG